MTASEKSGHAKIRVGRFNGANGEVHVDCKFVDGTAINGKHYKAQNHPITFHNTEVEKFLEVELLHTGLEDGVEFSVVLENVRSDHKERQPSLGHHTSCTVHVVADADVILDRYRSTLPSTSVAIHASPLFLGFAILGRDDDLGRGVSLARVVYVPPITHRTYGTHIPPSKTIDYQCNGHNTHTSHDP